MGILYFANMEINTTENKLDLIIKYLTEQTRRGYVFINISELSELEENRIKKLGYSISRHTTESYCGIDSWKSEGAIIYNELHVAQ
jgi:hypothetical protein